jgi:hypothetical protein
MESSSFGLSRQALASISLALAFAASLLADDARKHVKQAASLTLRVRLEKTLFKREEPVRFELSIQNPLEPCYWAAIDPAIAVFHHGDRPAAKIAIELSDARGRRVSLAGSPAGQLASMRDGDLLNLGCGKFFGEILGIGTTPGATWRQALPPGRYAVSFSADLSVRSYFESHPDLAELEAKRRHMKKELLFSMLPEQILRSEELEFVVSP